MMMNDTNVSVTITACSFTGKDPCKYLDKTDNESSLISTELLLVIVVVVLVVCVGVGLAGDLVCRRLRTKEDPEMEKNPEYNEDDEYYDEHENRIEDRNEYHYS